MSEAESARKRTPGRAAWTGRDHGVAATVGQVHIQEHHVGILGTDERHGRLDGAGLAHDADSRAEAGLQAGPEDLVIVDDHDLA